MNEENSRKKKNRKLGSWGTIQFLTESVILSEARALANASRRIPASFTNRAATAALVSRALSDPEQNKAPKRRDFAFPYALGALRGSGFSDPWPLTTAH